MDRPIVKFKVGQIELTSNAPMVVSGDAPSKAGLVNTTYLAPWRLVFNNDGSLNTSSSDTINLSWSPLDSAGNANGSITPQALSIDVSTLTQYGSPFLVNNWISDGARQGNFDNVQIERDGTVLGTYSNGKSLALGQIMLANFRNPQGLSPTGDTSWKENTKSGNAITGVPGGGVFGAIQAGSLEQSNVNLSDELVQLTIAQRDFQANVKTLEITQRLSEVITNI